MESFNNTLAIFEKNLESQVNEDWSHDNSIIYAHGTLWLTIAKCIFNTISLKTVFLLSTLSPGSCYGEPLPSAPEPKFKEINTKVNQLPQELGLFLLI